MGPFLITLMLLGGVVSGADAETPVVFTQIPLGLPARGDTSFIPFGVYPPGSRIVALATGGAKGGLKVLTPEFTAAGAPDLSFDARRVLFAGQRTPDAPWRIYEMDLDGSDKREVTSREDLGQDLGDCTQPRYLARSSITAPEFSDRVRWIVFVTTSPGTYEAGGRGPTPSLYVCTTEPVASRGGGVLWRATFNPGGAFSPWALRDGRVLYTSRGGGSRADGPYALMAMDWAGTGVNLFYGGREAPPVVAGACELPDRTVVFVASDGRTSDGGGGLSTLSPANPLRGPRPLSREAGRYRSPYPLSDGGLMVAYAPEGRFNYGIYAFDFKNGRAGQRIFDDPDRHDVEGVAVYPRPEPAGLITMVEDDRSEGDLYCLNAYESDLPGAGEVQPGQIRRVRLVEGLPLRRGEEETFCWIGPGIGLGGPDATSNGATPFIQTRILGEAPVARDGSFLLKVAADTPFLIQVLDGEGVALRTSRSWMWVRRRDQRGCIGCHEERGLAPENRVPEAIVKAQPALMTAPPPERRTVDFRRDLMPVIEATCATCHGGPSPAGGLDLGGGMDLVRHPQGAFFNRAYENLLQHAPGKPLSVGGRYVHPGDARNSPLIRALASTPGHASLTGVERRVFAEWIDLGAQWDNLPGADGYPGWRPEENLKPLTE